MKKLKTAEQHLLAQQNRYGSVLEAFPPPSETSLLGVKHSAAIKAEWVHSLQKKFHRHTTDAMAYKGRALDTAMANPLTGRCMTGSSSGTAVNVLLGINDLGLGTDGGGSVLYPALSVNLYSVLLSGLGFVCDTVKKSTDDISFQAGLGLMSFHREFLLEGLDCLLDPATEENTPCILAGDRESLAFFQQQESEVISLPESDDREFLIGWIEMQFQRADILLVKETQIDVHGYGDSLLGMSSPYYREQQRFSGKRIGKVLNMVQASAYTVPDREAGSGYLIIAKKGREAFEAARRIFEQAPEVRLPLFLDYFGS